MFSPNACPESYFGTTEGFPPGLPGGGITIFSGSGTVVAEEVNTGADRIARVEHVARDPGAYFIRVRAARGADTTGTYTLNFAASR